MNLRRMVSLAVMAAAAALSVSGTAHAELCDECRRKGFTADVGECGVCGAHTSSGAFMLCRACSAKRRQCEACGRKLKGPPPADTKTGDADARAGEAKAGDGKKPDAEGGGSSGRQDAAGKLSKPGEYVSGDWTYRLTVKLPGTRSEGRFGSLLYREKELGPAPAVNDYIETPWGRMYWTGPFDDSWGDHGWMPRPNPSPLHKPEGRRLAPEELLRKDATGSGVPAADGAVLTAGEEEDGKTIELNPGDSIRIELRGNPLAGFDWFRTSVGAEDVLELAGKGGWSLQEKAGAPAPAGEALWVARFKAVKGGSARLAFEYKRPGDRQPIKTCSISIKVREAKEPAGTLQPR
ncbi:MAG: protease inhibitor I42 family protein [Planctomycetota bacterium]|nr:protease inhibitor I42 family protein [Planctomycetota bacterium]